jgi:rhodanese-related sulfurtransferase
VDVRTPEEFAEGSVNDAVNIPLNEIESRIKEFEDKDEIIVFCRSGNRSSQAQRILQQNGIQHVVNGGTWQQVAQTMQQQ